MDKLCDIFECKKSTFRDWVNKYKNTNNLSRNNRNSISYKITNEQVKYAIQLLKQNQQITMFELAKLIKDYYYLDYVHNNPQKFLLYHNYIV